MILHEIFRAVSGFSLYISCYIAEYRFSFGQCTLYNIIQHCTSNSTTFTIIMLDFNVHYTSFFWLRIFFVFIVSFADTQHIFGHSEVFHRTGSGTNIIQLFHC